MKAVEHSLNVPLLEPPVSRENSLWGAPRIHGELLMLGIEVAQSPVAKYYMSGVRFGKHNNPREELRKRTFFIWAIWSSIEFLLED
jgi:hypothetical protein